MSKWSISVKGLVLEHGPVEYCVDCEVEFDLVNPKQDIYDSKGESLADLGQDEVNFRQVWISELLKRCYASKWEGCGQEDFQIVHELVLDFCRDSGDMHIHAFKHAKGYK